MRILSFIFTLAFAIGVSAQSLSVTKPFHEGTKFANSGDFERALSRYHAAFDAARREVIDSDHLAKLHYNLGVCEFRLGHNEQAIAEFDQAIKLKKGDYAIASYALGMAESARENWGAARLAFLRAIRSNKQNGEAWFDLAFAYLGEGDLTGAEIAFQNSITYNSVDLALSHNNVGAILAVRGDLAAAEKEFEAAVRASGGKLTEAKRNLDYCRSRAAKLVAAMVTSGFAYTGRRGTMF